MTRLVAWLAPASGIGGRGAHVAVTAISCLVASCTGDAAGMQSDPEDGPASGALVVDGVIERHTADCEAWMYPEAPTLERGVQDMSFGSAYTGLVRVRRVAGAAAAPAVIESEASVAGMTLLWALPWDDAMPIADGVDVIQVLLVHSAFAVTLDPVLKADPGLRLEARTHHVIEDAGGRALAEFDFDVDLCWQCLVVFPEGVPVSTSADGRRRCDGEQDRSIPLPCSPGQDEAVDCRRL